ncbi:MAG TPA: DEAD/DEAH box helicase [Candidatus Binatia bacterium]|jgi:superfamily II DNA or RNA helicase
MERKTALAHPEIEIPPAHDWRTTDTDEINKRRLRAQIEPLHVTELGGSHPIFANFRVSSGSGMSYGVEIRGLRERLFFCTCVDFRINGFGTCKHVEATLHYLEARHRRLFAEAQKMDSPVIDIVPDAAGETLRTERAMKTVPARLRRFFDSNGRLQSKEPEQVLERIREARIPNVRISQQVTFWLRTRRQVEERKTLLREYQQKVQSGEWPAQETLQPLYPYQREGMLQLAFKERALLADEMGLGKTIQAIAACALLWRLGKVARVLVVTPASLKSEWEEQIQRFTTLPYRLVFGTRKARLALYAAPAFFTITNYEQVVRDGLDINRTLRPEVVILDEAQRIKNWTTKTAQAVKRLESRYAFVLTGTPIENRIDELYSLMDFLNPGILGPLFRFNREFYKLDDRGRPVGYRNLDQLHARVRPFMLRRRKSDVETELPDRTDQTFLVPLSTEQKNRYRDHEAQVARLASIAKRRPLTPQESEKLLRELSMMRMVCDTNYILDPQERACPKLAELEKILEECRENSDVKVLIFSEWERMLQLIQQLCQRLRLGYAVHTGLVPQLRRRAEIQRFKNDPACRIFLSTDSGSTGLNLQSASVVINCDLPWNPARLEQRISRAWRKHQTRPVTVIHLVSEGTIEQKLVGRLKEKQALADGVIDLRGDLSKLAFSGGRQALLSQLQQLLAPSISSPASEPPRAVPVDRSLAFAQRAHQTLDGALVRCQENYPLEGAHSVLLVVVERDAAFWRDRLAAIHEELFGQGKWDPLAPVTMEVIDRATDEALRRLADAGMIKPSTRAIRALWPAVEHGNGSAPLSPEERQRISSHRQQASRKLKMAKLLDGGGLSEEANDALREATLWTAKALALENRLPEPKEMEESLRPPISLLWRDKLPALHELASSPVPPTARAMQALQTLLE